MRRPWRARARGTCGVRQPRRGQCHAPEAPEHRWPADCATAAAVFTCWRPGASAGLARHVLPPPCSYCAPAMNAIPTRLLGARLVLIEELPDEQEIEFKSWPWPSFEGSFRQAAAAVEASSRAGLPRRSHQHDGRGDVAVAVAGADAADAAAAAAVVVDGAVEHHPRPARRPPWRRLAATRTSTSTSTGTGTSTSSRASAAAGRQQLVPPRLRGRRGSGTRRPGCRGAVAARVPAHLLRHI